MPGEHCEIRNPSIGFVILAKAETKLHFAHVLRTLYLNTIQSTLTCMIRRFRHKGLQRFFETGSKAGVQATHVSRLQMQLARLDKAISPRDMNLPNWRLHALKGNLSGHWAVWVDEHWRLTFTFEGEDATLVDYQDYH